ncbi:MAG: (d)CMP kinase [Clostridia bacterium]|nr:(d)CMP kinase [Clostridia bacterium]
MISVAIDGPSGSGKSTISKLLAKKLGFLTLDTGALYRAVAYYFLKNNIDYKTNEEVIKNLKNIDISVCHDKNVQLIYLNGEDITNFIRTPEVSSAASNISAIPEVREFLINIQRDFAKTHNVIMDGRDIGTIILPNANVKFFLTASPENRAKRRYNQLIKKNPNEKIKLEDIINSMNNRDFNDSNRKISPLTPAKDAIIIDNSSLSLKETVDAFLSAIKERATIETK